MLSLAATVAAVAQPSPVIEYEGRLAVAGQPFTGKGQFKFALLDAAGKPSWTSDNPVILQVANGSYKLALGDADLGMKPLPSEVTGNWQSLRLHTWFDDGEHGWAEAGVTTLAEQGPSVSPTTAETVNEAATMEAILLEMQRLRSEMASLRQEMRVANSAPVRPSKPKPTPKPVHVSLAEADRFSLGSPDAPVVLVEFTDFECGYCKRFFDQTLPQLREKYIDTGKLRFVSRHYPIKSHPQAGPAAQALLSTAAQDPAHYWTMRAWLFANNRELSMTAYEHYVSEAGLDLARFRSDFAAQRHLEKIEEDIAAAKDSGITGTPSFVLGTSDGKTINGERIVGAKSFKIFSGKIDAILTSGDALEKLTTESDS